MTRMSGGWMWAIFLNLALFLGLGLTVVWLNIERVDLAYEIKKQQGTIEDRKQLLSKLQVERNNLTSPWRLNALAKEYGLAQATAGQMRRIAGD